MLQICCKMAHEHTVMLKVTGDLSGTVTVPGSSQSFSASCCCITILVPTVQRKSRKDVRHNLPGLLVYKYNVAQQATSLLNVARHSAG